MNQGLLENYKGKLLISHPGLPKSHPFYETVIYITQDRFNNEATIGVILNVATEHTVQKICNEQGILFSDGRPTIYKGGPVNQRSLIMLHSDEWHSSNTSDAGLSYAISSDPFMFEKLSAGDEPVQYRIFAGLTAWTPGQLSLEINKQGPYANSLPWLITNPTDEIIFGSEGTEQYSNALELCSRQTFDQYF
jgi:putative AlgH/UPF0301 family transcriptional regulator